MFEGLNFVHAHLVDVHAEAIGTFVPEKDPSAIHDNLVLALGHCVKPLAAALFRLPDDIVANLGPAEPEYIPLQCESGEGEL